MLNKIIIWSVGSARYKHV